MHDIQSLNEKLLTAVCRGKTGHVEKLLLQGANVNYRDKKDGMTPLLKACQRRNYTMQRILLSRGANPRHKDKLGLSCLHYIAEAGDTESLKMLMAYQASIDTKDASESTPLHYAADRNKLKAVDTLVFCGANAFQKNKKGVAAVKSTTDPKVEQILKESELVLLGIKNGDIHIESVELEPGKTYKLEKADITIHTPAKFPLKSLSFICRRVRPEYCHPVLKPYRKELLISDTFEFLTSETQTKANITIEVPLYDFPDPFEDIFMKTDLNPNIDAKFKQQNIRRDKDEKNPGKLKWLCTTDIDVTHVRSFNLVAFPTKEAFHVGRSHVELSSVVDKFIKITIPENTFSHPNGMVCLEVIPSPIYKPENLDAILSVGHFYDLTHDRSESPQKTVNLKVPLPHDYENDGDIYLLGSDVDSDYFLDPDFGEKEDLDHWEIIDKNPKVSKLGCVNIPVDHFSIYVASEAKRNKSRTSVIRETSQLCRRASMRQYFVVFLVLVKPVAENIFVVLIECTTKRKLDDRMNYWINKNYLDQKPSHSGEFESVPGTKYMLKLSGNVQNVTGFPKTRLEFHPKRENCQQFQVTMSDSSAMNIGSIDIYQLTDTNEGKEQEEGLVAVPFRLTGTPFVDDMLDDNESFKGFTKDSLLRQLCKSMGDEWTKVAVLLGLSYRTVEIYRTNAKLSDQDKKFKVMMLWRDTSKHREDYGVNDLVSVLHRIEREDLVQLIHDELEIWLKNNIESKDRFYKWAANKLTGPSHRPLKTEQLTPASEQFFVELIEKFGNYGSMNEIGLQMGLSRPENDKIFNDALTTNKEHQLLGMLVAAREKIGDMFATYVQLERTLITLNMDDVLKWIRQAAEDWIASTEKVKNPVPWRQELVHYMNKEASTDNLLDGEDVNEEEQATSDKSTKTMEHQEEGGDGDVDRDNVPGQHERPSDSELKSKDVSRRESINSSASILNQKQSEDGTSFLASSTPKPKDDKGSTVSLTPTPKPKDNKGSTVSLTPTPKPKGDKESTDFLTPTPKPKGDKGSTASLTPTPSPKDDKGSTASMTPTPKTKSDEESTASLTLTSKQNKSTGSTASLASASKPKVNKGSVVSLASNSEHKDGRGSSPSLTSNLTQQMDNKGSVASLAQKLRRDSKSSIDLKHTENKLSSADQPLPESRSLQMTEVGDSNDIKSQSSSNEYQKPVPEETIENGKGGNTDKLQVKEEKETKLHQEIKHKTHDKPKEDDIQPEEEYAEGLSHKIVDDALDSIHHDSTDKETKTSEETEKENIEILRENLEALLSTQSKTKDSKKSKKSKKKDSNNEVTSISEKDKLEPKSVILENPLPEAKSDSSSSD